MAIDYITYAYAAAIAAGGVVGYVKAGSVVSLAAGVTCGALLGMGAFQMSSDPRNVGITLAVAIPLTGIMGFRAFQTGKFMPAGLVSIVSAAMVARLSYRVYQMNKTLK